MNLRRWITALAVLAVFTVVAGAQVPLSQVTCTVSAPSTPNIRSEGVTERVGDLKLTCTGGLAPIPGGTADRATIVVDYGQSITSMVDANGTSSEIALVIDEPGTMNNAVATSLGIQGYGPNAGFGVANANIIPCSIANIATCNVYAYNTNAALTGYWVMSSSNASAGAPPPVGAAATPATNAYQGSLSAAKPTQVTFTGVPLVPPVGSGVQRIFRVVNVRINPNGATGPITGTVLSTTVTAGVSTLVGTGSAQVATSAVSLATSIVPIAVSSCVTTALVPGVGQVPANSALLKFGQLFTTAFKPRQLALSGAPLGIDNGVIGTGVDLTSVTGFYTIGANSVSNASESGLFVNFGGLLTSAGFATSGTRLKAVFTGLDSKATYYVSLNPVVSYSVGNTVPTTGIGDTSTVPYAALLGTQGSAGEILTPFAAQATAGVANAGAPAVNVAALTVTKGAAEAVWEVTNFKQSSADTYTFAFYAVFPSTAPPATGSPTAATVALSYAPTNGTAATTPVGNTVTWVPRYSVVGAAGTFFNVLPCQTTLLFPFLSNAAATPTTHWETGVAIANTGSDPLGTIGTSGTCTLNFYGANAPPTITTGAIAPGGTYTFIVSNPANASPPPAYSSFSGYMFAVCNFNYGHGFAFVEDDTRSMAMGYLGLVLNTQTSNVPRGQFTLSETLEN